MAEVAALAEQPAPDKAEGTMLVRKPQQDDKPKLAKMEYDRTYVAHLPGRSRPSFVRKRRYTRESRDCRDSGFGLTGLARALLPSPRRRRSYSFKERVRVESEPAPTYVALPPPPIVYPRRYEYHTMPSPAVVTKETVHTYPGHRSYPTPMLEEQVISDAHTTKIITRETQSTDNPVQHQCGSCGKYRSPSYQSRHPLAPGEIPKLSTCRSCIRKHTSSDTSDDEVRLRRSAKKYRKKYRHRRGSHLYTTDSSSIASTGEEDIRIIRRARSLSRDRHRLRSFSTSGDHRPRIEVTIAPSRPVKSILRRRTSDPVEVVEQTRYVERREPSLATSRSRGSSQWYEYSEDEPVEVEYRSCGYDPSVRRITTESYRPRRRSVVEYGSDGDYAGESAYGPIVRRHRSESVIAQHGTPIKVEKEVVIEEPRHHMSPRDSARRRLAKSIEYETYAKAHIQPPARSVRVINVPAGDDIRHERRGRGQVSVDTRSVSVTQGVTRRERSTSRHVVEETELPIRRRERSLREVELDSSDDYPMPVTYSPRRQYYRSVKPVVAPAVPRRRYMTSTSHDGEREVVRNYERTRVSPSRTYIPPPPAPVPRRVENHHSSYYRRETDDEDDHQKSYYHVPDGAVFYREV
ncbi:hypothetical protein MMC30_008668 [Trapelia coarctata]|nr:hypothetical protein [Trapelia coarctata]